MTPQVRQHRNGQEAQAAAIGPCYDLDGVVALLSIPRQAVAKRREALTLVVLEEAMAVRRVCKRHVQRYRVFDCLLHSVAHCIALAFRLDHGERLLRLPMHKEVVSLLASCVPTVRF